MAERLTQERFEQGILELISNNAGIAYEVVKDTIEKHPHAGSAAIMCSGIGYGVMICGMMFGFPHDEMLKLTERIGEFFDQEILKDGG